MKNIKKDRMKTYIVMCLSVFAVLGTAQYTNPDSFSGFNAVAQKNYKLPLPSPGSVNTETDQKLLKTFSKVFVNLAKSSRPALVFIATKRQVQMRRNSPEDFFFSPFFPGPPGGGGGGRGRGGVQQGAGSGFIVDLNNGYIITNNHVIEGADEIIVKTFDNREFKAKVIGSDKSVDVGVLKVEGMAKDKNLKQIALANSDSVEVGDWVAALGAPFELPQTLTVGIVSALGRSISDNLSAVQDFIQTDAAINPGNSGGPLLDLEGKVIGINTAIYSSSGASAGIGFAVPSNMARQVAEMIINEGKVTRGFLGIEMSDVKDLGSDTLKQLKVTGNISGAMVRSVLANTPAEKGGLKPGDVIQEVNGSNIENASQLKAKVAFITPGQDVKMGIIRDGKKMTLTVKVGSSTDAERAVKGADGSASKAPNAKIIEGFGLAVADLTPQLRNQYQVRGKQGVLVMDVAEGSPAAFAQLQRGDVILEIAKKPMKTVKDVEKALGSSKGRDLLFLIERDGRQIVFVLRIDR